LSMTITIPDEVAAVVERAARRKGCSPQQLVIATIREQFADADTAAPRYLQLGKYHSDEMSTEDDFRIAEWHGSLAFWVNPIDDAAWNDA